MSLRLTVPFSYCIEYVVKRRRTVETETAYATTDVEIQAPRGPVTVAFELGCSLLGEEAHRTERRSRSAFYAPAGETVKTYRAEDAYWVEICESSDAPTLIADRRKMAKDPFNVLHLAGEKGYDLSVSSEKTSTRQQIEEKYKKEGGLRRWDADASRGITATQLLIGHRALQDLREIDGKLCMRVSEPALGYVSTYLSGNEASVGTATSHLIVDQSVRTTPSGFQLLWDLSPGNIHRWRVDETAAAIAFDMAVSSKGARCLADNSVYIGRLDLTECLFEGRIRILEDAINCVRKNLIDPRHLKGMNGAELSTILELQQLFDRDAGRLSPEYTQTARRLLDLMEKHVPAQATYDVNSSMGKWVSYETHRSLSDSIRYLRAAVDAFDARPQDGREWIDRALPCGALADPVTQCDTIEVLSMRDGQRLVDAGCDRSVLEALKQAAAGETRVIRIEKSNGKILPCAGVLVRDYSGAWRLDRSIGRPGGNGAPQDSNKLFESFVKHANALDNENEALLSLAI
ncbi:hypothetical protein ACVIGB_000093 [Bradyrhizobium sp. USDA 4341]